MSRKKPTPPAPPPQPLAIVESTRFGKQPELQKRRGRDLSKLAPIIAALASRQPLDAKYRDHALTGDWDRHRYCHVEPDWVLIYRTTETELHLVRTGTHSDLKLA
jgi:mRNA interferase YafQ